MPIKKRNLDNSLIQWIMTATGLGPGIGNIQWLAKAASATSLYSTWLGDNNIADGDISATLLSAYGKTKAYRNDCILVLPGAYDEALELDWAKANTHLIGLGGPSVAGDYYEPNVVIYTDTTEVAQTIEITSAGFNCQFRNISIQNAGAHASNVSPLKVDGYSFWAQGCSFIGNFTAQQLADIDCASLEIYTNAHNARFIDCIIGEDAWGNRSAAASGQVKFTGSQPNGGMFKDCLFRSQSNTATVAMIVTIPAAGSTQIGRSWFFDNCKFNNYSGDFTEMNEVFHPDANDAYWPIQLHNCSAFGYDEWSDNDNVIIRGTMPFAGLGGGLDLQFTDDNTP